MTDTDPSVYWDKDSRTWKKGTFRDGRWQYKVKEEVWDWGSLRWKWVDRWYDCEGKTETYKLIYFHLFAKCETCRKYSSE